MKPDTAPRRRWFSSLMVVAIGTLAIGTLANRAVTQVPGALPTTAPEPTNVDPASKDYGTRAVAYINKNRVVTRAELAEFLIARGGYEKVELLVNKMIIEEAAREAKITVTTQEMEVAFADDLKISNPPIQKKDFVNVVLPRYGKSLYEWMEDVIRPRLLLTKMCRENVKVNPEDLTKAFENPSLDTEMPGPDNARGASWLLFPKSDCPWCGIQTVIARGDLSSVNYSVPSKFMIFWFCSGP